MFTYDTVTEAVNDLVKRGYNSSFALQHDCIYCHDKQLRLSPSHFQIDEYYRFEGNTDPDDETIVYAISSTDGAVKGTLVNAYGVYAETASDELISKLDIKNN